MFIFSSLYRNINIKGGSKSYDIVISPKVENRHACSLLSEKLSLFSISNLYERSKPHPGPPQGDRAGSFFITH